MYYASGLRSAEHSHVLFPLHTIFIFISINPFVSCPYARESEKHVNSRIETSERCIDRPKSNSVCHVQVVGSGSNTWLIHYFIQFGIVVLIRSKLNSLELNRKWKTLHKRIWKNDIRMNTIDSPEHDHNHMEKKLANVRTYFPFVTKAKSGNDECSPVA